MIVGIIRLSLFLAILFNTYYLMIVDKKITSIGQKLDMDVTEVNVVTVLKKLATNLDSHIEDQRNKVRTSLEERGIEERNKVLTRSKNEDMMRL